VTATAIAGKRRPVLLLAGPTAVGKSAIALDLAEQIGGEIISVDSMQVYRGLDIGTSKPTLADRKRVPHHLVDILDLCDSFTAGQFVALAKRAVTEIQERARIPILCGGTGLYFKAFLEGLGDWPAIDPALRLALEQTPLEDLLHQLATADPETFRQIDRRNPRRVIRAIEIIRLTGKPLSSQRTQWQSVAIGGWDYRFPTAPNAAGIGLDRSVADLWRRIDIRVERMFAEGLVAETQGLLERGLDQNRTAMQAIGYRQVIELLQGQRSLTETMDLIKARTRQYAKRQRTWFRHQARLTWFTMDPS
jgi:tRNA dimethylallyltransferase